MTDSIRQTRFVTFPDASQDDERMAAVLIAKDADTGALKTHVVTGEGRTAPTSEAVAMLATAVEIANL